MTGCPSAATVAASPVAVNSMIAWPPLPEQRHCGGRSLPSHEIAPPPAEHDAPLLFVTPVIVSPGGALHEKSLIAPIALEFWTTSSYRPPPSGRSVVVYSIAPIGSTPRPP